jgi:hypothetical protein
MLIKEDKIMQCRTIKRFEPFQRLRLTATIAVGIVLLVASLASSSFAQKSTQEAFPSAEKASHALFLAVQNDDVQGLLQILGGGKELISSDDEIEDKGDRELFARKYQQMHRLVREPDGTTVLYVGAENWPFPVPLVSKAGAWYFDSDSGTEEILFREIGENEATAIETCHALVRAIEPRATAKTSAPTSNDHIFQHAQTLLGTHETNASDKPPAGNEEASGAFHGYYFRILTEPRKSRAAPKGNVSNAGTTSVFIAYPAEYRTSGVMTFVVTEDGVVYERDLGPNTAMLARKMTGGTLSSSWREAE